MYLYSFLGIFSTISNGRVEREHNIQNAVDFYSNIVH